MEIPYTTTPRADTGLWNAKIGIWLFLASEVMLFGGIFSGYIFLRLGAGTDPDYEWPIHVLKIAPGLINTAVLILSSVTVILAWANLKLRNYGRYKICMSITLLCAVAFMGIKSYEYYGKLTHYGIFLKDGTIVTGHDLVDHGDYLTMVPDPVEEQHGSHGHQTDDAPAASVQKAEAGGGAGGHGEPLRFDKEEVFRYANHGPSYNTFYAIYYLLTGLHGLHVIGGASVLAYFLFTGKKMYQTNPEHLANRVEVGGLFWHFVDLIWIFLFPLLYLL